MGTSRSPLEFAGKCAAAAEAATHAAKVGTEAGALLTKQTIAGMSPSRLRGVGKAGRNIGVRYNVGEYPDGAKALVYVTGPWQLIERDTAPHPIPRVRGARARARFAVLPRAVPRSSGNGESRVFASVKHPGTQGKHPFEKGVAVSAPLIPAAYDAALIAHLHAIF